VQNVGREAFSPNLELQNQFEFSPVVRNHRLERGNRKGFNNQFFPNPKGFLSQLSISIDGG